MLCCKFYFCRTDAKSLGGFAAAELTVFAVTNIFSCKRKDEALTKDSGLYCFDTTCWSYSCKMYFCSLKASCSSMAAKLGNSQFCCCKINAILAKPSPIFAVVKVNLSSSEVHICICSECALYSDNVCSCGS